MLKEIKIIYLGDLYRFYTDESGEVACVLFYPMMGTMEQTIEWDEVPKEVITQYENLYLAT
jgi:hypothetical protein